MDARHEPVWTAGAVGVVATLLVVVSPEVPLAIRSAGLQAVLETTAGLITLAAALIVYGRFRQDRRMDLGLLLTALLVFGLANLVLGAGPVAFPSIGESLDTWGALVARVLGATLFAAAAVGDPARRLPLRVPLSLAIGSVGTIAAVSAVLADQLPPAVPLAGAVASVTDLTAHPFVTACNVAGLIAFGVAAVGFARRSEDPLYRALAAAAVLGGFARLHLALVPSLYTGAVYSGDVLRLAFHASVLGATVGEVRRYWSDQQDLAVADERRRVARELHDGMAQELAFIATTTSRIDRDGDTDIALIASAARRALDESRRAIATLTRSLDEPLPDALAEAVEELAVRSGGHVELSLDPTAEVVPAVREELLRIAREAVGNALRHAAADLVTVTLEGGDGLRMVIVDDGCGFDPDAPGNPHGFGLTSMQERAAAMGASFHLDSSPGRGTRIAVAL